MSKAESVVVFLEDLARGMSPGERIGTKEEVRSQVAVAVGTFNEALRVLVSHGVLHVRPGPGGGLFVADTPSTLVRLGNNMLSLSAADTSVEDAMRVRDALDDLVNEDAARHRTAADLRDLRRLTKKMARRGLDASVFVDLNWQLHRRIAEISPNVVLKALYVGLIDTLETHTESISAAPDAEDWVTDRAALHHNIVEAIAAEDVKLLAKLGREHTLMRG